jgi:hypothetical protein
MDRFHRRHHSELLALQRQRVFFCVICYDARAQGYSEHIAVSEKVWLGSSDKTTRFGVNSPPSLAHYQTDSLY